MQFLTNTKIPFLKYRKVTIWVSVILLLVAVGELFFYTGLNLGIDFAGGTQMTVVFRDPVEIDALRDQLAGEGLEVSQIQRLGAAGDNEVLFKMPVVEGSEEGSATTLIAALDRDFNEGRGADAFDLNQRGTETLARELASADPEGVAGGETGALVDARVTAHYLEVAEAVMAQRTQTKVFNSWDQLREAPGVSPEVLSYLESNAQLGAFNVISNENVGPQIGAELRRKGVLAVVLSLIGMLGYIWYRFELRFGIGAVVAAFHDFLITLGLYALMNYEFNLATIAAFLTLVGYSVNDTVVIFDRVRENMRRFRRKPLEEVMNVSINQTLSRTALTSGTTLLAAGCLFVFGGDVIRGFAFVLVVGVVIGTYSSLYVASPFALLWDQFFASKRDRRRTASSKSRAA